MADVTAGETEQHKAAVRDEFTRQAPAYATAAVITDAQRLARLVEAIDPRPDGRALEASFSQNAPSCAVSCAII